MKLKNRRTAALGLKTFLLYARKHWIISTIRFCSGLELALADDVAAWDVLGASCCGGSLWELEWDFSTK